MHHNRARSSGPRALVARNFALFAATLAMTGCASWLLGADSNEQATESTPAPVPLLDGGTCGADRKACGAQCVSRTDPAYGCRAESCAACATASCGVGGQCAAEPASTVPHKFPAGSWKKVAVPGAPNFYYLNAVSKTLAFGLAEDSLTKAREWWRWDGISWTKGPKEQQTGYSLYAIAKHAFGTAMVGNRYWELGTDRPTPVLPPDAASETFKHMWVDPTGGSRWIAGTNSGTVRRLRGANSWSSFQLGAATSVADLAGTSDNDLWASTYSSLWHLDGVVWSPVPVGVASGCRYGSLERLLAVAPGRVWGIGAAGPEVNLWTLQGVSCIALPNIPATAGAPRPVSIWGTSEHDVYVQAYAFVRDPEGAIHSHIGDVAHWDGNSFAWFGLKVTSLDYNVGRNAFRGISGSGPDDIWAVGEAGSLLHFTP